jgi:hypothetical protein
MAVGAAAGAPASSEQTATIRLTNTSPLTLRGTAFKARERVTLTVQLQSAKVRRVRKLTTGPLGGFTARFSTLIGVDRCEVIATAVGARGSRAMFKAPLAQCKPGP